MMENLVEKVRAEFFKLQDIKYRDFSKSLCTTSKYEMIGVRSPEIRKIAKMFPEEKIEEYIFGDDELYYEELLLKGFLTGRFNKSIDKTINCLDKFVPKIDNWGVCDGTCASLKITQKYGEEMWNYIQKFVKSKHEYEIRFAFVMYLDYYTKSEHVDEIFKQIESVTNDEYYVKMAIAWLLAECFVGSRAKTLKFLKNGKIDKWTYNKAIQKMIESYRVSDDDKKMLRNMKKK